VRGELLRERSARNFRDDDHDDDGGRQADPVQGLSDDVVVAGWCRERRRAPGIYMFDEFGVRLEDCMYMTDEGPAWFTVPPDSLDDPIGRLG